ncbi:hypothetical protein YPPY66_2881 [Yersinia pestis PY-66]|uniref:Uncharacterized protein n=1 Tax=Yersinia pestis PY-08 TaxID=992134 RepID=A0AB72ZHX6_YERPE|nr:hypothetical protein YpF1991016_3001 [Yersinia pestis biovar Orientalis str. F1991016]EDR42770.1 hypothetical protein YpE1979001_4175 [Yersinia pestis biovar Antiqua str. E1979001]EDR52313.1 hypothetical protein YpB42003004_1677 [Yersinia pestis biovar Antiqua str. B42003004]EDR57716.1 hypothetical protein YpMG051020_3148 [Yersinia pestis biovar Orientalis str. MG05-1020]EDR61213.1 hypothetical protein YpUG050454_4300 [Yersinia pestis biovar Antiqua str. UG05-0454]EDR65992.1 hypothetical pr
MHQGNDRRNLGLCGHDNADELVLFYLLAALQLLLTYLR